MRHLFPLALALAASAADAAPCDDHFGKSGNPFSGTNYTSHVVIDNLSTSDALGQMRALLIAEKLDVLTEDAETGSLLAEQRSTNWARPVPTIVTVSGDQAATRIDMTVKTEKGVFAKADAMRTFVCSVLNKVQGGDAGRAAGLAGAKQQNQTDTTVRDVFMFSRDIANEANKNAIAVNARHKGRAYALKGRIDHIMEDGEDYNVSFEIPEVSDMVLKPLPGSAQFRVGVACLFRPNQLAWVLTMREGQSVMFQGSFYRYDDFKKMVWLENCKQLR